MAIAEIRFELIYYSDIRGGGLDGCDGHDVPFCCCLARQVVVIVVFLVLPLLSFLDLDKYTITF